MQLQSRVVAAVFCLVVGGATVSAQMSESAPGPSGATRADPAEGRPSPAMVRNDRLPATELSWRASLPQPASARRDSLVNGALIGGAIGAGIAIADYAVDPSEPSNAAIAVVAVGLGALIGAGVDALIHQDRAIVIMPVISKRRGGVRLAVRF